MRVVGGTDYISIAEQQKYFQWFSTDFVQRLVQSYYKFLGPHSILLNKKEEL